VNPQELVQARRNLEAQLQGELKANFEEREKKLEEDLVSARRQHVNSLQEELNRWRDLHISNLREQLETVGQKACQIWP
jgi:hypothetical protein